MTYAPFVHKCPKGHPIDNDEPCGYCKQEKREQDEKDDKLLEQLLRLNVRGKLAPFLLSILKKD